MQATLESIREETTEEVQQDLGSTHDPYEEKFLPILLERMQQAKDMTSFLEAAKLYDKILERREARRNS